MIESHIDKSILFDFIKSQPDPVPRGSEDENDKWNIKWKFFKKGCDLTLYNNTSIPEDCDIFLNRLTSGRGDSKVTLKEKFKMPNKYKLPKDTYSNSLFFLDCNEEELSMYNEKNGYIFGNENNYRQLLFLLLNEIEINIKNDFNSWEAYFDKVVRTNKIIINDYYILKNRELWESNIIEILFQFSRKLTTNIEVLLLTKEVDGLNTNANAFEELNSLLRNRGIVNIRLIIVFLKRNIKHDRNIICNYQRVKSGDSFNYVNSKGVIITTGDDSELKSLGVPESYRNVKIILDEVKNIIKEYQNNHSDCIFGKIDKFLL